MKKKVLHIFSVISTPIAFFDGQFKFLKDHGYEVHFITSPSEQGWDFANRNGALYYPTEIRRSISPWADIKAIYSIIKYIKQNKIPLVVGHTPKGALVAMIAAFFSGIRNRIYYRHGVVYSTAHGINRFLLKNEERFVSRLATDIVNVSESLSLLAVKDCLNKPNKQFVFGKGTCGGIDAIRVFNPGFIDSSLLNSITRQYCICDTSLVFGFVGRICRDKGITELYDGFQLFRCRYPHSHPKLLLVGCLDDRDQLPMETIERLKSDTDVIMTGEVGKSMIPYYYSLMDVFVFPSYREGFGMSVIEASAMKKPILVSRSHGCIDSIVEGETGLYIDITAESICRGMDMMRDTELRRRLGEAGRERVVKEFDQRVLWPKIAEYYDSFFNSHS